MTTKIGLISDIHSTMPPLQQALDIFTQSDVRTIICAGDVAGYGEGDLYDVIKLLQQYNCLVVSGNHDTLPEQYKQDKHADFISSYFASLPVYLSLTIENKNIYVVHAHPPDNLHGGIKLLQPNGDVFNDRLEDWKHKLSDFEYDVLIIGHTHQVFHQDISSTLVINPGSTYFNHSCMILSLPDMTVEVFPLQNKAIVPTWNWGIFNREHNL